MGLRRARVRLWLDLESRLQLESRPRKVARRSARVLRVRRRVEAEAEAEAEGEDG